MGTGFGKSLPVISSLIQSFLEGAVKRLQNAITNAYLGPRRSI